MDEFRACMCGCKDPREPCSIGCRRIPWLAIGDIAQKAWRHTVFAGCCQEIVAIVFDLRGRERALRVCSNDLNIESAFGKRVRKDMVAKHAAECFRHHLLQRHLEHTWSAAWKPPTEYLGKVWV